MRRLDQNERPATSSVEAFVAVGANIAPRINIEKALRQIMGHVDVIDTSTFYLTDPEGGGHQPRFVNGMWRIGTGLAPRALKFEVLRKIEGDLGRRRSEDKHAPRVIDLDLVLYGDSVIDDPDLAIPAPDIYTRPFVAVPLVELAPTLVMPDTKRRVTEIESATRRDGLEALEAFTAHLKRCIRDE
jgi:2-amino-4-hydroxy-6-hydroxymethyldihydropteridine diphosphokinase